MKRIIATASALFMLIAISNAQTDSAQAKPHHPQWDHEGHGQGWQGRRPGSDGPERHGPEMAGRWGDHERGGEFGRQKKHPPIRMTEDQRNQAKAINESYEKQLAALYSNDKMRLGDFKTKSAELRKERENKLTAILTPEQKGKIEEFKKRREENHQVMAAARMERMKIELGLKDEQVASIKAAEVSLKEQMKALHEDETILPELKRGQMKALMEKHKETVKALLTPEQINKLESMKKHREGRG